MFASIVPLSEEHFDGLHKAFDLVARERRFLAFERAPPAEETHAFYRNSLANDSAHFVAISEDRVVGWCDVPPARGESRAHVGILGIALLPEARGQGIGRRLMEAAIAKAWSTGLRRIELTVRADNLRAKALYERMRFELEGTNRGAFCVDGQYVDSFSMALVWNET